MCVSSRPPSVCALFRVCCSSSCLRAAQARMPAQDEEAYEEMVRPSRPLVPYATVLIERVCACFSCRVVLP